MEDSEKPSANPVEYQVYTLDKYLLTYNPNIKTEKFSCEQYYGIVFIVDDGRYQVLHNKDLGDRIIINRNNGHWHDIPFKPATFHLLPHGVEAKEIG